MRWLDGIADSMDVSLSKIWELVMNWDCGFVVEPEVRQVDSSSSILLSQDCFGYSKFFFFFFHKNCETICSVKNTVGSFIGIALNL